MNDLNFVHLVKVSSQANNNRYYRMIKDGDNFRIEMGRVGATPVISKRPMSLWSTTFKRKIAEGYEDRTDYCQISEKKMVGDYAVIKNDAVQELISTLQKYANMTLEESYTISYREVSRSMIEEAQDAIYDMSAHQDDLYYVRQKMEHLFIVIPRKMKNVSEMLPDTPEQIPEAIQREQEILDVMETKVSQNEREQQNEEHREEMTILDALQLDIRECMDNEVDQIKKHMGEESSGKFRKAFRVFNHITDKRFDDYMIKHNLKHTDIHYLYHGSRNMNYFGLISEGPKLNPKAPITGKMFGHGIYFANRARKSIGYTDLSGAYWSKGTGEQAYLAVYKVVYKNQKDVYKWSQEMTDYTARRIAPHDAVFAHKGESLYNDEVIIYDEAQITLQYIIELKAEE